MALEAVKRIDVIFDVERDISKRRFQATALSGSEAAYAQGNRSSMALLGGMAIDDLGEDVGEVDVRVHAAEFAVLDQRCDDGPVVASAVGTRKRGVFAIEGHRWVIVPMSGRSWSFIIAGIHITAAVFGTKVARTEPMARSSE